MTIHHTTRPLQRALFVVAALVLTPCVLGAQHWLHDDGFRTNKSIFRALDWPDPTSMRNAYSNWRCTVSLAGQESRCR